MIEVTELIEALGNDPGGGFHWRRASAIGSNDRALSRLHKRAITSGRTPEGRSGLEPQ